MQFGGVDFARVSLSPPSEVIPKLNVLQMPYLYVNSDHMWSVLEGDIGDEFLDSFGGSSLVALSWYDAGARSFYSARKPIRELKGYEGNEDSGTGIQADAGNDSGSGSRTGAYEV